MKLRDFPLLTDENIDEELVFYLRQQRFDVKDVYDVDLLAAKDPAWLRRGYEEKRVIVTQDGDFGQMVFTQPIDFVGIVFLRLGSLFPEFHLETFEAVLALNPDLYPPFMLTAEKKIDRVRVKVRQIG